MEAIFSKQIIITADGSTSFYIPKWKEHYHSKHGAIQESDYVFLKQGLDFLNSSHCSILEIGLGTGLNCFMTYLKARKENININYTAIEAFPITKDEKNQLNFVRQLNASSEESFFDRIHTSKWGIRIVLSSFFSLIKKQIRFEDINEKNKYNLIYFDAFGPRVQPELWTETIFRKMYEALMPRGVLVTYSAKGSVRRNMQSVGFDVERLPGPPGKREMLRATKAV